MSSEQEHAYHGDICRVGNRAGHTCTAVCNLGSGLSGSGLYTDAGRALWMDLPLARPSLCAPLCVARDLGWCDHDYPRWGEHTSESTVTTLPVLVAPASIMGRSSHVGYVTGLRPFAVPRSSVAIIAAPLLGKREKGWGFAAGLRPFIVLCPSPRCRRVFLMYRLAGSDCT